MFMLTTLWPQDPPPLDRSPREGSYWLLKRATDILVASIAVLLLLPVMVLIAVAIPLESRGPILYSQDRVGCNRRRRPAPSMNGNERRRQNAYGQTFRIYKFRSMVADAEGSTGAVWATSCDPRVTRVGRFLRRTHLDELPQLFNVLRGEMSVVGPRPERPEIVEQLAPEIPGYVGRLAVLPGITGLAQVTYRYDSSFLTAARKLRYDIYYIHYGGLLLDLKIMAATILVMARAKDDEGAAVLEDSPLLDAQERELPGPAPNGGSPNASRRSGRAPERAQESPTP